MQIPFPLNLEEQTSVASIVVSDAMYCVVRSKFIVRDRLDERFFSGRDVTSNCDGLISSPTDASPSTHHSTNLRSMADDPNNPNAGRSLGGGPVEPPPESWLNRNTSGPRIGRVGGPSTGYERRGYTSTMFDSSD